MSDTAPAPTTPPPPLDTWTLRVTTSTAAAGFLAGVGALIWVMVTGDPQTASIAMGFVGGTLVGGGAAYFMRGRVENPTQTRTGTGSGGAPSVAVQNAEPVNAQPTGPVVPNAATAGNVVGTPTPTTGGGVGVRPPGPPKG